MRPTPVTKKYLLEFLFRLGVFLCIGGVYLFDAPLLDFTAGLNLWLVLLWLAVLRGMLVQLSPKSGLTAGCMKQYPSAYEPQTNYSPQSLAQAVRAQNLGALRVAAVWLGIHVFLWTLYARGVLGVPVLLLLCALYFLCDLVCVLFFCPFQTFLMKNRCCVNCRIFAWGSWMMAVPLACVPHWYAWTLVGASLVVLLAWEMRFRQHPERFWYGSNRRLTCAACQEQLCRYKYPRSPRFQ